MVLNDFISKESAVPGVDGKWKHENLVANELTTVQI